MYIVRGVKTLLLGQPAIEKLGLIPNIPETYRIRAVNSEQKGNPEIGHERRCRQSISQIILWTR